MNKLFYVVFVLLVVFSSSAFAEEIFFEDWESASFSTNNWSFSGPSWEIVDYVVYAGTYTSKIDPKGTESFLIKSIDTTSYENIYFSFYAHTNGMDSGEYLASDWYNGTDWINLLLIEDINTYTSYSYDLPSSAEDNCDFKIRFRCYASNPNERCYVDNIAVNGSLLVGSGELEMMWLDPDKDELDSENNQILDVEPESDQMSFMQNLVGNLFSFLLNE